MTIHLQAFTNETRIYDIDVKDALRQGDTLDATFVPTATVTPNTAAVDMPSAIAADSIIRFRFSASATGFYTVTLMFRTMQESSRKARLLIRVD